ncbi:glycosyltransferase family A protein [Brevibacterium sp. K11IcPPYGO002]|uniref:glycosyltransferase family 2 protein n=1 Tax=Brevibacterium sp. K11IcPPYGO002 TaxID=3058837 RepID=UPI003D815A9C
MTTGARLALRESAQVLRKLNAPKREGSLLIQRSELGPDILAALLDGGANVDASEVARIARRAIASDPRAIRLYSSYSFEILQSLARVLCLSGRSISIDQGIDILQAVDDLPQFPKLDSKYRRILIESLIVKRRCRKAAWALKNMEPNAWRMRQYRLGIHSPFFDDANEEAIPATQWLKLFNEFLSPSSDLHPVELKPSLGPFPFDQLWSAPKKCLHGPVVTVVMSTYRRDDTILGAVHSILNQTWRSLELLIIDDDSGLEYQGIYQRLAEMDPRIRVVRQRVNGGTYLIRNRAITLARGEFITFQDSDDWSHPERLERQIRPMLDDPLLVATQSSCVRTDDYLNPVQIGYPKVLRRNESSLMFRAEAVRRIGYFHYTRKGGDSEYRLRMEAAYQSKTPIVGDEPLAIVRLTSGSLSRNEFAPGFRHPNRLIYSQGFGLVHKRCAEAESFYRPLHEYIDSFVPSSFKPRLPLGDAINLEAVLVADLRSCAEMTSQIVDAVAGMAAKTKRIGLAHAVGMRFSEYATDKLDDDVSALFVDGHVEPVVFGERRSIDTLLVSDPSLLQHIPWGATEWEVGELYLLRVPDSAGEKQYDEATVAFNCVRLFGQRPTWIDQRNGALRDLIDAIGGAKQPALTSSTSGSQFVSIEYSGEFSTDAPIRHAWKLYLADSSELSGRPSFKMDTRGARAPIAVASASSGAWCAVVGWPGPQFGLNVSLEQVSRRLLGSWMQSAEEFDCEYADVSGDCVVIRCDARGLALRATARDIEVDFLGSAVEVSAACATFESGPESSNQDELVRDSNGAMYWNPIDVALRYDGSALDELQQVVAHEYALMPSLVPELVLDDDFDSAVWLGLLRGSVGQLNISILHGGGRLAKFLDSHFVEYSVVNSGRTTPSPLSYMNESGSGPAANPPYLRPLIATSVRARNLGKVVRRESTKTDILERLWTGLSSIVPSTLEDRSKSTPLQPKPRSKGARWITDDIQDCRDVTSLALPRKRVNRLALLPDLSLNEEVPLAASFVRGKTDRLVVSISNDRVVDRFGFVREARVDSVFPSHHLTIVDTTYVKSVDLSFGWLFGTANDNLIPRWAMKVRELITLLDCKEILIRGSGRGSLPAIALAQHFHDCDIQVDGLESVAGARSPSDLETLEKLILGEGHDESILQIYADRLTLQGVASKLPRSLVERLGLSQSVSPKVTGTELGDLTS